MRVPPDSFPRGAGPRRAGLIDLAAQSPEFLGLLAHAFFHFRHAVLTPGRFRHFLADPHGTEFGAAHGAEMGNLRSVRRQGLIME